ncbi:hypothetical protein MP638_002997 [Amoeboaphelidium occidentale]|nr:hypothetical protein MP638_002997 [Amoeboaphelidium occidentale]
MEGKRIQTIDVEYSADSVEVNYETKQVLCGTYQLEQEQNRRIGRLYAYQFMEESVRACGNRDSILSQDTDSSTTDERSVSDRGRLSETDSLDTEAILDMKWFPGGSDRFMTANADGALPLYSLSPEDGEITEISKNKRFDSMCLSMGISRDSHDVVTSLSSGNVAVLRFSESDLEVVCEWKAHDYESWIACFSNDGKIVYSGGDDCKFQAFDTLTQKPVFSIKRKLGVTSISPHPRKHLMAVGSYDESVILYDTRNMSQDLGEVTPVSQASVGGGVWRLKWNPLNPDLLLCAAMHNGFFVLDCSEDVSIHMSYKRHQSLAYGADWVDHQYVSTCSFYDHTLHLWKYA